jgi:hypothetical protein
MAVQIKFEIIKYRDCETTFDGIKFEARALFAYMVRACGLDDEAKRRNVEISIPVDGTTLNSNTHHVTIGFKMCDKMAHDPIYNELHLCE